MAETHFQGGTNTRTMFAAGTAGSNVTFTGVATKDVLQVVQVIEFDTDGDISAVTTHTTDTATISAANTVNLSGVTTTADKLVYIQYVDVP